MTAEDTAVNLVAEKSYHLKTNNVSDEVCLKKEKKPSK